MLKIKNEIRPQNMGRGVKTATPPSRWLIFLIVKTTQVLVAAQSADHI